AGAREWTACWRHSSRGSARFQEAGFYLLLTCRVSLTRQAGRLTVQLHGGGGMDQELVQYLDERFGRIEQRLDGHDQRFERIDRRFDEVNERIDEDKRHSGLLGAGLRQ